MARLYSIRNPRATKEVFGALMPPYAFIAYGEVLCQELSYQ